MVGLGFRRHNFACLSTLALSLTAFVPCAHAQLTPVSPEVLVNTYTTGSQGGSRIAELAGGGFVVVWGSENSGMPQRLFARVLDAAAAPISSEIEVPTQTSQRNHLSSIAALEGGGFVVVWAGASDHHAVPGGLDEDVLGRVFDATGTPTAAEFRVNSYTTGYHSAPAVDATPSGGFVVVWKGGPDSGGSLQVFERTFDASASPLAPPVVLTGMTSPDDRDVSVAPDGSFVVAYESYGFLTNFRDEVLAHRFDSLGAPIGTEFLVNTFTTFNATSPSVDHDAAGNFVLVWTTSQFGRNSAGQDGTGSSTHGQRYDATGAAIGAEFQINTYTTGNQAGARVSVDDSGSFVVAWLGSGEDDPGRLGINLSGRDGVFVQRYDASGVPDGSELLVRSYLPGSSRSHSVAMTSGGSLYLSWSEDGPERDGSDTGVFARTVCDLGDASCDRCPGFDDGIDPDGDALPSGCDPCTNVAGSQDFVDKSKVSFRNRFLAAVPSKNNRMRISGELALPPGTEFTDLDFLSNPMRVRIESDARAEIVDAVLAPGAFAGSGTAGWRPNGSGTTWKYLDRTGAADDGIVQVVLKDRSSKAPGQAKIKITGKAGFYTVWDHYNPLRAIVVFGEQADADAGLCAETNFVAGDCDFSGDAEESSSISCRK